MDEVILIGYSGHAYVVADTLMKMGLRISGYCEESPKSANPFSLEFLGSERNLWPGSAASCIVGIGNNKVRKGISEWLVMQGAEFVNAVHPASVISSHAVMASGIFVAAHAVVNPLASIAQGVICNTSCIIEHEVSVGAYSHIAPGAVLCGSVKIGSGSFIGAGSVVKQGVSIGNNVTVGAGTVVLNDVPDNSVVIGNPQRFLVNGSV